MLEARKRVGGRTLNHARGGGRVTEIDGQWIGPTQHRFAALADALGVKSFPTFPDGENVGSIGVLVGFIAGDQLRVWRGRAAKERRAAVLDLFGRCFGPQVLTPRDYLEKDWTAEWWTVAARSGRPRRGACGGRGPGAPFGAGLSAERSSSFETAHGGGPAGGGHARPRLRTRRAWPGRTR